MDSVQRRRELIATGVAEHEVRQRLRRRELLPVRRGSYLLAADGPPSRPEDRHLLAVHAALPELAPDAVVSHVSAALLFGLPVWGVDLSRVHVTRSRRSGARRGRVTQVHAAQLDPDEVVDLGGRRVTVPVRTIVDMARSLPFAPAVAVADAALHRHLVTPADLAVALARAQRRRGAPAAARVADFADGRSMSVGESRSRIALRNAGIPAPVLQWGVVSRDGMVLGEVDFGWPGLRTVGEFDGRAKYGRLLRSGQDPGDAVFAEKVREDAIRDEDLRMVRWIWRELDYFAPVAERLRHAFA